MPRNAKEMGIRMSNNIEVLNYIKGELKNFNYLKMKSKDLQETLVVLKHKRDGLPSPNYEGIRIENSYSEVNPLTILDEQINRVMREKESIDFRIKYINSLMANLSIEDAKDVERLYVSKVSTQDGIALERNITVRMVRTNIDNALLDAYYLITN